MVGINIATIESSHGKGIPPSLPPPSLPPPLSPPLSLLSPSISSLLSLSYHYLYIIFQARLRDRHQALLRKALFHLKQEVHTHTHTILCHVVTICDILISRWWREGRRRGREGRPHCSRSHPLINQLSSRKKMCPLITSAL